LKVSNQYIELGVEFAFNCLNRETTLQISEEAKSVLEGLELMSFEIEDFDFLYNLFQTKYTNHENWRVTN